MIWSWQDRQPRETCWLLEWRLVKLADALPWQLGLQVEVPLLLTLQLMFELTRYPSSPLRSSLAGPPDWPFTLWQLPHWPLAPRALLAVSTPWLMDW